MQIERKCGPGKPKRETVVSGNSTRLTLVIGMCENPMRDLQCVPATWRGAH